MLKIYYADISGVDINKAYLLSDYRRGRIKSITNLTKRREGIGAELLLNYALKDTCPALKLPPDIMALEHGKPVLRGGDVQFSLSHSAGMVAVALCDCAVGVDIQEKTQYNVALARRFFCEDERMYIDRCDDKAAAFTAIWCAKESYIKALGTGLNTALGSFSVIDVPCVRTFDIGAYMLGVCAIGYEKIEPDLIEKIELPL